MKFTIILALALTAVMCLAMFAGCGNTAKNYAETNAEYVIGLSGPLTGGAAMYGVAVANAAQMAVDEINAAGGLNGVSFKLMALDDVHDATKVATSLNLMPFRPPAALISSTAICAALATAWPYIAALPVRGPETPITYSVLFAV